MSAGLVFLSVRSPARGGPSLVRAPLSFAPCMVLSAPPHLKPIPSECVCVCRLDVLPMDAHWADQRTKALALHDMTCALTSWRPSATVCSWAIRFAFREHGAPAPHLYVKDGVWCPLFREGAFQALRVHAPADLRSLYPPPPPSVQEGTLALNPSH